MTSTTSVAAERAAEPALTPSEKELAHLYLRQTQCGLTGAIKGLSDAQWKFAPAADRWSIAEIAEHVIFVFDRVLGPVLAGLATAPPPPSDRDCKQVDAIVISQFPVRLAKFPAPEISHPAKTLASPSEAIDRFSQIYAALAQHIDSAKGLRLHAIPAAPLKAVTQGAHESMDGYQWILASAAHAERHTKQILEVRADPNFPW